MKTLFGFIGWILGMFFGFMFVNSIPLLGFALILGGIPLGRYLEAVLKKIKKMNVEQEKKGSVIISKLRCSYLENLDKHWHSISSKLV